MVRTVLRDIISPSPFQSPRGYCQVSSPISMSLVLHLGRLKAIWQQCVTPKSHWGWGTPLWETCQLEYVVKGLKQSYRPGSTQTRLPISPPILRGLRAMWSEHVENHDASMLWAASCMCFFGFLRVGEIVIPSDSRFDPSSRLTFGDVRIDNVATPYYLEVRIKASKTDPFQH